MRYSVSELSLLFSCKAEQFRTDSASSSSDTILSQYGPSQSGHYSRVRDLLAKLLDLSYIFYLLPKNTFLMVSKTSNEAITVLRHACSTLANAEITRDH